MMLQRQGNTVTSAIALISSSIILGCARPEIPQASTLPPTFKIQVAMMQ
ncbi:hypothetical protein [Fischerella thermalis]|nr:hypothetical protein [Fischerella thermalis]